MTEKASNICVLSYVEKNEMPPNGDIGVSAVACASNPIPLKPYPLSPRLRDGATNGALLLATATDFRGCENNIGISQIVEALSHHDNCTYTLHCHDCLSKGELVKQINSAKVQQTSAKAGHQSIGPAADWGLVTHPMRRKFALCAIKPHF